MSQAPVGQRSAQRPQCTHTSSSLSITREVCGNGPDAKMSCVRFLAGALNRFLNSGYSPSLAMVKHRTGHTSTQASHSMHNLSVNTV